MKKSKIGLAAAIASIIATIIALISLILQIINPELTIVKVIEAKIPYLAILLFLFAFIAMTYFLISKLLYRIGDIRITGDVITTQHIGDYVKNNIDGIDKSQLELIITTLAKKDDIIKSSYEKFIDTLDSQQKIAMVERILEKNPEIAKSNHITEILKTLRK